MTLENLFNDIKNYHKKLDYPGDIETTQKAIEKANEIILALHNEVTELQESYPWKPWRPEEYKKIDFDNMAFEIIDILFFLGSFMEIFSITSQELEQAFEIKLAENYKRIEKGYNEVN
jgi:phosphoribosyl-ATP pyrophosphohydrolase